jgi:redox-sensitive bicupin YhaK (pirin superfamily)
MSETTTPDNTRIDVRAARERFRTQLDWLDSSHSFSFGPHHDPANTGHGLLIVNNDDTIAPGGGFGTHPHRDMEIITWVLSGALEHRDSEGNEGIITPGLAQRMSAGAGIRHSERNASDTEPVRLVQMWVVPDEVGIPPGYEQRDVSDQLDAGGLVAVASGDGRGAIHINQRGATRWAGRLGDGTELDLPDAPFVHLFVATGSVHVGGELLGEGDAARLTGAHRLIVDSDAEVLVWESAQDAGR